MKKTSENSKNPEGIIKTSKPQMKIKISKESEHFDGGEAEKLSKKQKNLLKEMQGLRNIVRSISRKKDEWVKGVANNVFQRTDKDFKMFERLDNGNYQEVESTTMDSSECPPIASAFKANLSYEILAKFPQTYIGWQNCAILKQNGIIDRACSVPPEDAMSTGYKIAYSESEKRNKKEELDNLFTLSEQKYRIQDVCVKAATNNRVFGWSLIVPTFNKEVDMSGEFDISKIDRDSYTGMTVIEPFWISYDFDQSSYLDPTSKYFYEPTWYKFPTSTFAKKIHRSWVIKLIYSEVPTVFKPTFYFGGVPLTQQIYEAVYSYEKSLNETLLLLLTKRSFAAPAEISAYNTNQNEIDNYLTNIAELHNNFGIWVTPIGTEIKQMDTTLTGITEVVSAHMQRIAAISEMSMEKLFKIAIKGLNSSGQFESNDYKQLLIRIQKKQYLQILNRHYMLLSKSLFGRERKIQIEFNPIDTPDELTKAKIRDIDARTLAMRLGSKVTDRQEERERLIADPNSGFSTLPPEPPEIDNAQENAFSVEKDNMGRPLPKAINNPIRAKSKEDVEKLQLIEEEEQDDTE